MTLEHADLLIEDRYRMLRSPIKWVGGKLRLRKKIIELIPPHTCYVEVFGGAAWVLFGKPPSQVEVLNDIDQELITFFRVVKKKPDKLIKSFAWELVSRAEYNRLAKLKPPRLTDVQRAHRFYYLVMAGWGGELHSPRFQTSISDGGHGNRLIGALKTLEERLNPIHHRLQTVIIENLDWRKCIDRYDRRGTVLFLDPPYPDNPCNYAHNMRGWEEHKELAKRLHKAKCKWILSSYDIEEVRDLYRRDHIVSVSSPSGMETGRNSDSRTLNEEVLVTNFVPSRSAYRFTKQGVAAAASGIISPITKKKS